MATTKIKCPVEGIIDLDRLPGMARTRPPSSSTRRSCSACAAVKQLGFTEPGLPGATHTRFAHSLGAFQGAQRTLAQLRVAGADIPDAWFVATALACLLHDLGHGPFSHTFESVTGTATRAWTSGDARGRDPQFPSASRKFAPARWRTRCVSCMLGESRGARAA